MPSILQNTAIAITWLRHSLCRRLCPDLTFNSDMSREIDHWLDAYENACVEIERLIQENDQLKTGAHKDV